MTGYQVHPTLYPGWPGEEAGGATAHAPYV